MEYPPSFHRENGEKLQGSLYIKGQSAIDGSLKIFG